MQIKTNKSILCGNVGIIQLTKGMTTIVDAEDFEHLNEHKWQARQMYDRWYAMRKVTTNGRTYWVRMHRQIMHTPADQIVHHIHGRTLDNRKSQLENAYQKDHQFHHKNRFPGRIKNI